MNTGDTEDQTAFERRVDLTIYLDTNRINAKNKLPNVTRLEELAERGVIWIALSRTAFHECLAGGSPDRSEKAMGYLYFAALDRPDLEAKIGRILYPDGISDPDQRHDVEIIRDAIEWRAVLVTNDGGSKRQPRGMIGCRKELETLGARIMTDEEAVREAERLISERDGLIRREAAITGYRIPWWVGVD